MKNKKTISNYLIFSFCLILSLLVFFTFRIHLVEEFNLSIFFSFICFQLIIWSPLLLKKNLLIISNSLFFLVVLNLITTPLNYLLTFDLPYNPPNTIHVKDYKNTKHFKGIFDGKHTISFDHMTYRTNKKINYEKKNSNTLRIFTIGGSTTAQVTLDDKKTWSTLLEKKLEKDLNKNVEVINTGVLGFASSYHYLTLKKIEKYNPDLVIILVGINDWNNHIVKSKKNFIFTKFEINCDVKNSIIYKSFKNIKKQIFRKIKNFNNKKNLENDNNKTEDSSTIYFNNESLWTENREYLKDMGNPNSKKEIRRFRPNIVSQEYNFWINKIIRNCKKNNYTCVFMDQPNAYKIDISENLKSRLWMTPLFQDYALPFDDLMNISNLYNNWLKDEVLRNNINFVPLSNKIPPKLEYFFDDVHFTEKGSIMVSEILFKYIKDNIDTNKL